MGVFEKPEFSKGTFAIAETLASFDRLKTIAKNLKATVIIQHDPRVDWDRAWGVPVNQEDLLETLLTFTEIVFEVFDRTGVVYSEDDADAFRPG